MRVELIRRDGDVMTTLAEAEQVLLEDAPTRVTMRPAGHEPIAAGQTLGLRVVLGAANDPRFVPRLVLNAGPDERASYVDRPSALD